MNFLPEASIDRACGAQVEVLESRQYLSVSTDANGWTVVTPSSDSRIIYVSNSGSDNNSGLSPSAPLQTIAKGLTLMRLGMPDELLLKRGDTFATQISFSNYGRSAQEPMLISYYGDNSLPRPVVDGTTISAFHGGALIKYFDLIGIDFTSSTHDPTSPNFENWGSYGFYDLGTIDTMLIEDCRFRNFTEGLVLQATPTLYGPINNVTFRRNEVYNSYTTDGNAQGMYAENVNGLTIQDNIFDQDGWTPLVPGAGRNTFSQGIYIHSSCTNCVITDNIFANAAAHGLQARGGGIVDDNLFINDPAGFSFGLVNGATTHPGGVNGEAIGNVILGSANGGNGGIGIELGNIMPGGNTVVSNNLIANAPTISNNPAFWLSPGQGVSNPQQEVGLNSLTIQNNTVYNWGWGIYLNNMYVPGSTGANALSGVLIENNQFQQMQNSRIVSQGVAYDPRYQDLSGNSYYYTSTQQPSFSYAPPSVASGSPYYLPNGAWGTNIEPTSSLSALQYADPTRGIGTYMATLGLTATSDAFLALVDNFNKQNWDTRLMPLAVNPYVQAGYTVDSTPPTAALATPANIVTDTSPSETFTVTYSDNFAVDTTKLATGNLLVTGPGNFSQAATLLSISGGNGPTVTATYQITAPNNTWTSVSNGTYIIALQNGQVKDTSGNAIAGQNLGSFVVALNPAQPSTQLPAQPTNFSATPAAGGVQLNWSDPAQDQSSFLLQRADDSGFTTNVASVVQAASTTGYLDRTAVVGKSYYYELFAVNAAGQSAPVVTGGTLIIPPAPTALSTIFDDGIVARTPITSVTLPFTQRVIVNASMVSLTQRGVNGGSSTPITVTVQNPTSDGKTWVLSFSGTGVSLSGALADGTYDLIVHNSSITDAFGQAAGVDRTTTFTVDVAPTVTGTAVINNAPPHSIAFTFSKDVSASLSVTTLVLSNTTLNVVVPASSFSWNASTLTGTWTFNNPIPDGNYVAKLPANSVTDAGGVKLDGWANGVAGSSDYLYSFAQTKPSISLSGASSIFQGNSYTLTLGTVNDLAKTVSQYIVHWGDGSPLSTYTSTGAVTHTYTSGGSDTISVDVVDSNGTHTNSGSLALTIYRATLTLSGYSYSNTGALYTLTSSNLSDPGQTVSQYIVHWGDSTSTTYANTGSTTSTFTHTYSKAASANIVVDVVDGQGVSPNAGSLHLTVNGTPQIQLTGDVNANVGGTYRLALSAPFDPGFTVSQYTVRWGDGTVSTYTNYGTVTHTYAIVGTAPIAVDLTDSTGTYANAGAMTTKVNAPPTIAVSGSSTGYLNSPYTLTLGPVTDPGQTVTQYIVHWGDSSTSTFAASGAVTHTYTTTGSMAVSVDLVDGTGSYSNAGSLTLSVPPPGPITLSGNNIYLKQDADQQSLDIWADSPTPGVGTPSQKIANTSITLLNLSGKNGNDAFTLDESAGVINFAGGVSVSGGAGNNGVYLIGTASVDTVSLAASQIQFNASAVNAQNISAITYTDTGGNDTINLSGATPAILNTSIGNDTINLNGSGLVTINTAATGGGAQTLNIPNSSSPNLSLNVPSGTVTITANTGTGIRQLNFSNITIGATGKVVVAQSSATNGDYSKHGNRSVLNISPGGLSVATGGTLDLNDNDLILHYAPANESSTKTQINNLLTSGFDGGGWDTGGINSSTANFDAVNGQGTRTLGYADNQDIGNLNFDGVDTSDGNEVIIKFTWYGDADLSGKVDSTDLGLYSQGRSGFGAGWDFGDFDYSGGKPNGTDIGLYTQGRTASQNSTL